MSKEEKGFSFLAPIVVIVFLLVMGFGVYLIYKQAVGLK
jgi:hypothetical protein